MVIVGVIFAKFVTQVHFFFAAIAYVLITKALLSTNSRVHRAHQGKHGVTCRGNRVLGTLNGVIRRGKRITG